MSNKQARRAAKAPTATRAPATSVASVARPRIRASTGMVIGGGVTGIVGSLMPWVTTPDGVTWPGYSTIEGVGTLVLSVTLVALGAFIQLRRDHPRARQMAYGGLVAAMGIAAMGLLTVSAPGSAGARVEMGVLFGFAGGMVATLGVRGLIERL